MASTIYLLLFLSMIVGAQSVEFTFEGFNGREKDLTVHGASIIMSSGLLRLTNKTRNVVGQAFYSTPIQMLNTSSNSSPNASSFSTTFVFQIVSPNGKGGFGLAFTLAPSNQLTGTDAGHYLGLFNTANDGNSSNHIFAVEFDTVNGFNENADSEGNHVGININSVFSTLVRAAAYSETDNANRDKRVEVGEPTRPLISYFEVDLSAVVKDNMYYAGFSSSTGEKVSSHYILGWSFSTEGEAPLLNYSRLPAAPISEKTSSPFRPSVIAIIASLCGVAAILFAVLFFRAAYMKRPRFEALEDWELDCPHRFRYQDLHTATKGFINSEIIGVGGFGSVYRGRLPTNGNDVAVKKISTPNSSQGLRGFTAEIESLGRLRHKNLVNLQGWCKRNNDLLLVYDFIPNGSLAGLLFSRRNTLVLSWEQRFNIVKGIAAGLLYLHEEWEKVVIHRDVKSSNVLIDAEMNGRLGDFGLARLYDHGTTSHTTKIVGTIGYLAPELTRTGHSSTSSDVYAFGILLLEVACGRKPVDTSDFILTDFVVECHQMGKLLDAADPKLNSAFVIKEMEVVLGLGLLCSHPNPKTRPTMREVIRYLNWEDKLPVIDDLGSSDSQSRSNRFMGSVSIEMITSSIDAGR
uniref:non-specific serine/threonine protein kinase n=1 Tax=Salix viminalis TaxID=40686 RepID=A0A6N2KGS1_SALVM